MHCVLLEAEVMTSFHSGYFWLHRKEETRIFFLSGFAFQGGLDTCVFKQAGA